ncbi:MAG: D-2-hydroxyacid dehydrogenase family protein [Betaproteobacteria bacterium]|nr:D-2-hydroxyacid dehydrogenase family protein [Betaproteobacteria bacterium]
MKIVVLDDYADMFRTSASYPRLQGHEVVVHRDTAKDLDQLVARLAEADVVVATQERTLFPRALIEKLPRLKLIAQTGSHRHHFDRAACSERGILVCVAPGGAKAYSTAELTWALILAAARHLPYEVEQMKRGHWNTTAGTELRGKTLGVYGLGKIGGWVAEVGHAFGMKVTVWGREASKQRARETGYEVPESREAFFAEADVLTLHLFANAQTEGIVKAGDLAGMKPTSLLVNTSRMRLIEPGALVAALKQGRPGYAAVDVYEEEPVLGADHPLLHLPNALCTPHLGYAVREKYEDFYRVAADNILAFAAGKPINVFNDEVLGRR